MILGLLNDHLTGATYRVCKKDTDICPALKLDGNPLKGETLYVSWSEFNDVGLDLRVDLGERVLVHQLVLKLGEKFFPYSIRVTNADKSLEYYRYSAETGQSITKPTVELPIEAEISAFVIEFDVEFYSMNILGLDVYGSALDARAFLPTPKSLAYGEGFVSADCLTTYTACGAVAEQASAIVCERYGEQTGVSLRRSEGGAIRLADNSSIPQNGYTLSVTADGVTLEASDLRGMVYGAEVLLKMLSNGAFPLCTVADEPYMPMRGVHLYLPAPDQFDFAKRLVRYVLSPMGYNVIIMEIAGCMQFDSHPEINETVRNACAKAKRGEWPPFPHGDVGGGERVPKALIKDFVAYCRSYGIEVVPEVQSLGHVQFMTFTYPEIAELPEKRSEQETLDTRVADALTPAFYPHSYCPSNPRSYEILFDLLDEIIEVFEPREYVHMGHDEVYQIGICPVCKHREPADLYAEDVCRIYDYLKKRGLKMMIWSDMIQPVTKYRTPSAIHKIPKDILCLDFIWYFHLDKDIEDNLLTEGFRVAVGNLYSSHFPRYESRIAKEGMVGGEISAWVKTAERELGREGKLYDFLYSAEMLWSKNYMHVCRYAYDAILRRGLPALREKLSGESYPSLAPHREVVIADHGRYTPDRTDFGCDAPVNACADSLIFEHTASQRITRLPWIETDVLGHYEVTYADGERVRIPVDYAGNLSHWNRRYGEPFSHKFYRHNGYSATYVTDAIERRLPDGRPLTVYRYEWINPRPAQAIAHVRYVSTEQFPTNVFVERVVAIVRT